VLGRPADPVDVVTRIYFQPGQIGILNFEMVGFIDEATAAIEDKIWEGKSTDALVGRNDQPRALPGPGAPRSRSRPRSTPRRLPRHSRCGSAAADGGRLRARFTATGKSRWRTVP